MAIGDTSPDVAATGFPLLREAQVGPSPDGQAMLIEALTVSGETVRLAIGFGDIQKVAAFLLSASAQMDQPAVPDELRDAAAPVAGPAIPVTGIAVGITTADHGLLAITVGRGELAFSLPLSSFQTLGETLLTASARSGSGRLS
jgi:hypothetical protein